MQTKVPAKIIEKFFGSACINACNGNTRFNQDTRVSMIGHLRNVQNAKRIHGVETRTAFVQIYLSAPSAWERRELINVMGISTSTLYAWKKVHEKVMSGNYEIRTIMVN